LFDILIDFSADEMFSLVKLFRIYETSLYVSCNEFYSLSLTLNDCSREFMTEFYLWFYVSRDTKNVWRIRMHTYVKYSLKRAYSSKRMAY